jgi:hypothetical protein
MCAPPPEIDMMPSNQSANVWLGRFSSHLLQLRPDLHLRAAVQRGVAVYTRIDSMPPEEAAYLTSRLLPERLPEHPGRPIDAIA